MSNGRFQIATSLNLKPGVVSRRKLKSIRQSRCDHGKRNAFATAYVQPGTKLYTIADLSTVWVYAQVFQSDIARIKIGDPATVTTDAWPGRSFPGRVSFIQPQVDETTRTLKVRLEIPNPKSQLSPGLFVNVNLDAPLGRQLTIPTSGVLQSGTRQIAFVDRGGGYFEPREVETGDRAGDDLVVLRTSA